MRGSNKQESEYPNYPYRLLDESMQLINAINDKFSNQELENELEAFKSHLNYLNKQIHEYHNDNKFLDFIVINLIANKLENINSRLQTYLEQSPKIDFLIEGIQKSTEEVKALFINFKSPNDEIPKINKQLLAIENSIEKQKERLNLAIDQFKNDSSKAISDLNQKSYSYDTELNKILNNLKEDARVSLENYIKELEKQKKQAENIVHIISGTGLAGSYQKVANNARNTSYGWQFITVCLIISLIFIGYKISEFTFSEENIWIQFIPKVLMVSVIGVAVKYSSNQTSYYQERERINRKIQLELESLEPYISVLNPDEAHALRTKLADNYFVGQKEESNKDIDNLIPEHWSKGLFDLLNSFTKYFNKK